MRAAVAAPGGDVVRSLGHGEQVADRGGRDGGVIGEMQHDPGRVGREGGGRRHRTEGARARGRLPARQDARRRLAGRRQKRE